MGMNVFRNIRRRLWFRLYIRLGNVLFLFIIGKGNIHHTFTGTFQGTFRPGSNALVDSLERVSNGVGLIEVEPLMHQQLYLHTHKKLTMPITTNNQFNERTRSRPLLERPPVILRAPHHGDMVKATRRKDSSPREAIPLRICSNHEALSRSMSISTSSGMSSRGPR